MVGMPHRKVLGCSVTLLLPSGDWPPRKWMQRHVASCLFLYRPPRKWMQRHAALAVNLCFAGLCLLHSSFRLLFSAFYFQNQKFFSAPVLM